MSTAVNPYGDGKASIRIVNECEKKINVLQNKQNKKWNQIL